MLQQILQLGKKDARPSQSAADVKRKKRKQSTDGNIFIGTEESSSSSSKPKRIKIVQVKKHNGRGRPKKTTKASDWPELNAFQVTHHPSPKIWDMFERFQNFAQRRVLKRHPSGLLESSVDETTQKSLQSNNQPDNVKRNSDRSCNQTSEPFLVVDDTSSGGDKKRRCVEICDYEDEFAGRREPQPASAFKPKCLNFDHIDDS